MNISAGLQFGTLLVKSLSDERSNKGEKQWIVECNICGEESLKKSTDLRRGRIRCYYCQIGHSMMLPLRTLYQSYKTNAAKRNRVFEIELEEFKHLVVQNCSYCNVGPCAVLTKPGWKFSINYNGLDRVDNDKGYTMDNIVTCCKFCNLAKRAFPVEEFQSWLDKIRSPDVIQGNRNRV